MRSSLREAEPPSSAELQHLWFSLARHRWSALSFVPACPGIPVLELITELTKIGRRLAPAEHLGVVDGRKASLAKVPGLVQKITARVEKGERVLVGVDSLLECPAGVALLEATDAALLCVTLDETDLASARRTLKLGGKELFLGTVALRRAGR